MERSTVVRTSLNQRYSDVWRKTRKKKKKKKKKLTNDFLTQIL